MMQSDSHEKEEPDDKVPNEDSNNDDNEITPESDLRDPNRRICVVTTASLPWRTGTAVNPLARALYLTRGRPKHHVTLVIPWLRKKEEQAKLFGEKSTFETQNDQENWIRGYCKERVHCEEEADNLKILFYSASYHSLFGSIFATEDICSLIPSNEADIAILEEPEHLNWFRVPPRSVVHENDGKPEENLANGNNQDDKTLSLEEQAELGWTAKFKHVVGILHTNYSAYMQQYGIGTSIIAASALGALSSIVVRAYCHRLIRLSATLPHLDESKEVTSNVHGVRSEFLEPVKEVKQDSDKDEEQKPASIYFIGKLIWAKGFDKLLEIQEDFRESTGEYFPLDIYGGGNDETAIKRAFFGRKGIICNDKCKEAKSPQSNVEEKQEVESPTDRTAALVFGGRGSLRGQLDDGGDQNIEVVLEESYLEGFAALRASFREIPLDDDNDVLAGDDRTHPMNILGDISGKTKDTGKAMTFAVGKLTDKLVHLGFHVAFSKETMEDADSPGDDDGKKKRRFRFDPPKSRFELRRQAIPARFLGVKDHALIRDIVDHTIFLNLSTTEVLCTTTAEALAMGKFVIIPKHPSNEFFTQFPNCLSYETPKECVEHIKWAMKNAPQPLSKEHRFTFSWEGANERLFEASGISIKESKTRQTSGAVKGDIDIAKLHIATVKKGHAIHKLIPVGK